MCIAVLERQFAIVKNELTPEFFSQQYTFICFQSHFHRCSSATAFAWGKHMHMEKTCLIFMTTWKPGNWNNSSKESNNSEAKQDETYTPSIRKVAVQKIFTFHTGLPHSINCILLAPPLSEAIAHPRSGKLQTIIFVLHKLVKSHQYFVNYKESAEYLHNRKPKLYTCFHGNPICGCCW